MDITSNYHKGADTSILAHASTPSKIRIYHKQMIWQKIEEIGDATCNELEKILKLTHQTASARISELLKDNIISDSGIRRMTDSNRPARVYKINKKHV